MLPNRAVPNIFSPDNDGENDFFNVTFFTGTTPSMAVDMGPIAVTTFKIFNRWGELVYNNENPTQGWDGMHNDEPAPSDVYIYMIEITLPNGSIESFQGDVTLIR